jgi:trk system potassium uptake protein TrkH
MVSTRGRQRWAGTSHVLPLPFGIGLVAGGLCVTVAAIIGLVADGDEFAKARVAELVLGVSSVIVGLAVTRLQSDMKISSTAAMSMFVVGWTAMTGVAIVAFWLSGELATPLDAVFEAVSASTTTGFTTVAAPEDLSRSLLFLRASMPWAMGLGVLLAGMGVLPASAGGAELLPHRQLRGREQLVTTLRMALRNIIGLYLFLTIALMVGYLLAGMHLFDGVTYALSTASTGGMANHGDSIGHFDSSAIEWIASAGMAAAGGNLMVVWWALRGRLKPVWHSTELRLYVSLLLLGFLMIRLGGSGLASSDSAVAISSMLSTTGLRSANWAAGTDLTRSILLVAGGIGAMSGSVGSGFRLARVARVALEVRRSLQQLLNPNRVGIIRVDDVAVNEGTLQLTYGYLWMHAFTLAGMSVLLYTKELDIIATLSFAVGLVSNVGILVNGAELQSHVELSGWTESVASFGMLLGRLSIYPVLLTLAGVGRWLSRLRRGRAIGLGV